MPSIELRDFIRLLRNEKCTRLLVKPLARNDNAKNQIYFGPSFEALNLIPNHELRVSTVSKNGVIHADVDLSWVSTDLSLHRAEHSKLILYPQYPEVRFSGFLRGCDEAPCELFSPRVGGKSVTPERILILGIASDARVIAYATDTENELAKEVLEASSANVGVFLDATQLLLGDHSQTTRELLIVRLREIAQRGYVSSRRLDRTGSIVPCSAPNCAGYTLESLLGIRPNGFAEPDFHGWEIKQHSVTSFSNLGRSIDSGVVTLMTPEPNLGHYRESGVDSFLRRFGYADRQGRHDRINFGGIHKVGDTNDLTGLTMRLRGYDSNSERITEQDGAIELVTTAGEVAAGWTFSSVMEHWKRKHAQAAYVPSHKKHDGVVYYAFGRLVRLGTGTDFLKYLRALSDGDVYYDPGIKMENASAQTTIKRRSQFRIKSRSLGRLYQRFEVVDLL